MKSLDLRACSAMLRETAEKLDSCMDDLESMCGQKFAEEYIRKNGLEGIRGDIMAAIHVGFISGFRTAQLKETL